MKKLHIPFLILVILAINFLVSCTQSGASSNAINCSAGKEVCITIDKIQPFTMGEPMPLNIIVSSTKDFTDLHVSITTHSDITVDGPESWESYLTKAANEPGLAYWNFAIKAGQTLAFKRVLRFPAEEGYYSVDVEVVNTGRIIDASDGLDILLEKNGVYIAQNGTPLPIHTPNVTSPAYGPGTPHPTDVPNFETIVAPSRQPTITPTYLAPLVGTSAPLTLPYPPPATSTTAPYPPAR
ncbi:MAG TPA: hypothetical protein VMT46_14810 [Anaerolineaceae bacterium]|nr:hypothetical protein [Anaerolineaceae bacterium]